MDIKKNNLDLNENNFDISKLNTNEDIKCLFDFAISETRSVLERMDSHEEQNWNAEMACMVCCSILCNLGIKCDIIPISKDLVEHYFIFARIKTNGTYKYYILDPVYEKFITVKNPRYKSIRLKLEKSSRGKELIKRLVDEGYFEYNEIDLKLYCDGFMLATLEDSRDKESGISGSQYFEQISANIFPVIKIKTK